MEQPTRLFSRSMGRWLMALLLVMVTSLAARAVEAYACYTPSNTTLTFYYDNYRSSRTGTTYDLTPSTQTPPGWVTDSTNLSVTKVVFDSSFANYAPASNYRWFYNMSNLTTITNISNLNTQIVISMKEMFLGCSNLTSINLSGFNTAKVLNMSYMFEGCSKLTSLDLSGFNTAKVQSMFRMFYGCTGLTSLNLSGFSNDNVTDMESMFYNCSALTNLNLCGFSTPSATKMNYMFYGCSKLTSLDLSSFNTANVTDMLAMFYGCAKLVSLDLSRFNTANVTRMSDMFYLNRSLASIFVGSDWNTDAVTGSTNMFMRCDKLVGGQGTTYNSAHLDKAYAHIDGGPSNPGYFTDISDMAAHFTLGGIFYRVTSESPPYEVEVTYKNSEFNSYSGSVTIPSTVTQLGYTFSVTGIGEWAFAYSTGLTSVTIPSSVTSIGEGAFAYCSGLTSVTVPSSVTDMGNAPFGGCDGLTTLKVASGNPVYDSRGNCNAIIRKSDNALISGCKTTVIPNNVTSIEYGAFVALPSLTSIAIPSSVGEIGFFAFQECTGLTSVTIPPSVALIRDYAFAQCTGLTSVTCQAEIPPALDDVSVFDAATYANATLTVPPGTVSAYQDAFGWSNFAHVTVYIEPEAYACYTPSNTTLTFYYDTQRSTRTGTTYNLNTVYNYPGWYADGTYSSVTKVVFDSSFINARPTSTYSWFYQMSNLTSIMTLENLKTSNVILMSYMFYNCSNLTSLDVSNFKTANVVDMCGMFYNCNKLTTLDLSSFNTSKVGSMEQMFWGCGASHIFVSSSWTTAAVTVSDEMFNQCENITGGQGTTYDVNHIDKAYAHIDGGPSNPGYFTAAGTEAYACFTEDNRTLTFYYDTQRSSREGTTYDLNTGTGTPGWRSIGSNGTITKVVFDPSFANARPTTTCGWFYYMTGLTSITGISYLNTSQVTNMKTMFFCCTALTSLDVSHFNTAKVTTMESMFRSCSSITSLDVSNFNTAKVTDMAHMFDGCSSLTTLDVSSFNTANVINMTSMFNGCNRLTSLDVSNFNTANVTDMSSMFYGCRKLTSLDVSHFNTAKVTTMRRMLYNCSAMTSLDLGNINTAKVTDMSGMFGYCTAMTSLDLRGFNTSRVTAMGEMFYGCTNLVSICVGDGWTTDAVTSSSQMFNNCTSIVGEKGTTYDPNHKDKAYAHIDGGPSNPGYLSSNLPEAYACYTPSDSTLTFYYDSQRSTRTGTTYDLNVTIYAPYWYSDHTRSKVTKVVFDPSFAAARPTTTCNWFTEMKKLESITGMEYLNTSEVTVMSFMFSECMRLKSLDLSHFNTSRVTNMQYMFYGCDSLASIDLSSFETLNVNRMAGMFYNCRSLMSLDLSGFNTSEVTDMQSMFQDCSNLRTIYVGSGWTTNAVTSSSDMFTNCTSLVGGQGTTYDASHVGKAYAHIDGGPSNPGYFTAEGAEPWHEPEAYACYTPSNTTLTFYYDNQRSTREGTIYDLNVGMANPGWDDDNSYTSVTHVVFDPSFANARPVSTCSWFWGMTNLQSITGMDCMNTEEVTTMWGMFSSCSSLTTLDLSSFNTSKVTNMLGMFSDCSNLTTIYAGEGWSMATVSVTGNMFTNCTKLVGGKGTTYDPNYTNGFYARIDGGPSSPGYFTDKNGYEAGDVNGDGRVTIADVSVLISSLLSGEATAGNGDINGDGRVTIADVSLLINQLLGSGDKALDFRPASLAD